MVMRLGSGSGRWNASFEVMANSRPGIAGTSGRPPVEIRILSAVTVSLPTWTVWRSIRPASTHMDLHARPFEQADVDRVQAIDLLLHVVAQRRPGMRGLAAHPAVGRRILELVRELGAIDQKLLRHAAPDHAGAADAIVLADADSRAVAGGNARSAHAARAGADDEQVVVVCHEPGPQEQNLNTAIFRSRVGLYRRLNAPVRELGRVFHVPDTTYRE